MSQEREHFRSLVVGLTTRIAGRALDQDLQRWLNEHCGPGTLTYETLREACVGGSEDGWMCNREAGGIRYGRVLQAAPDLHGYSVDVVDMREVAGPHHRHPQGEIDMIMPIEGDARFDGHAAGWCVYGADTAHRPTVTGGRALVMYLLPEGRIEFTR